MKKIYDALIDIIREIQKISDLDSQEFLNFQDELNEISIDPDRN